MFKNNMKLVQGCYSIDDKKNLKGFVQVEGQNGYELLLDFAKFDCAWENFVSVTEINSLMFFLFVKVLELF